MSNETDAKGLRELADVVPMSEPQRQALQRIAAQLESDAKQFEKSKELQDIGKSAFESIAEMVAALESDYDRLKELLEQRAEWIAQNPGKYLDPNDTRSNWSLAFPDENDELGELCEAAGECTSREEAETRIHEDALSVEVRSAWTTLGETLTADEFCILLGTGGPAVRIIGELSDGEPTRARLQTQDWFLPWTDYIGADQETLLTYCRCFYFGEG